MKYFGLLLIVMSRAAKFTAFDPTKEMAYLPLGSEQRYKAKAGVDIVGAVLGL